MTEYFMPSFYGLITENGQTGKKKAMRNSSPWKKTSSETFQIAFSVQHLSHSHIMPRTLPVVVIIFAACIGFPQH